MWMRQFSLRFHDPLPCQNSVVFVIMNVYFVFLLDVNLIHHVRIFYKFLESIYDRRLMAMCGTPPHLPSYSYIGQYIAPLQVTIVHLLECYVKIRISSSSFLDMSIVFSNSKPIPLHDPPNL
jgi:hypothetical protein